MPYSIRFGLPRTLSAIFLPLTEQFNNAYGATLITGGKIPFCPGPRSYTGTSPTIESVWAIIE